jgi:hypothetical protein
VIAKKACTVCVCNYFVCVIAKHCWLFYDRKKSLDSVCLQLFLCVIASNAGNFMIEKKPEQCVFATILCV